MNREERRRLSRANKRWLAAVAADPRVTHEELLVARAIAENASPDGRVWIEDFDVVSQEESGC